MRVQSALATAVYLSSLALANPAPAIDSRQTGRVVQVAAGTKKGGPVAYAHAFKKHNLAVPPAVAAASKAYVAAAATQTGHVAASPLPFDTAYLCPVTVGKANLLLDFDTGSSDLWVFSKRLPANEQTGHHIYMDGGSLIANEYWSIHYGDGTGASGVVYADSVKVGGVTATVQAVEAATSVAARFVSGSSDGLLGLGFQEGNTCYSRQCNTFMTQIGPTLPKDLFTATLRHAKPGEYDFGYIDTSKYTGTIAYTPITDNQGLGYWEFTSTKYAIGSGAPVSVTIDAIADTGTTLALMDSSFVNAYYSHVPTAVFSSTYSAWVFPCSTKLPSFTIYIGATHRATVPGSYINHGALNDGTGDCYGGIQSNGGLGFQILGDTFLRSQFVVFDQSVPRLGFAQQAGIPSS